MNIRKYEINKPSELCQVVFIQEYKKEYEIYKMNPLQLDMLNGLIYKIRETIIKNKMKLDDEIPSTLFEISLKDFAAMFNSQNNNDYTSILQQLNDLSRVQVVVNALGKNKDEEEMVITRFIHEIRLSRHKHQNNQKIRVAISNIIINKFLNIKKYFSKMFFAIQFSMVSKYSKLLYELLKDYEGIKQVTIDVNNLHDLMNVVLESQKKWMGFNNNILKKTINEINEKSDIIVSYEPIKEKLEGQRKQVTKIKFNIHKQSKQRLQELGLIEEPITSLPFYNKSKTKLDNLVKNGYNVIDEDMWIQTDIKKNKNKYDAEVRIDNWIKNNSQEDRNELYEILANNLDDCEDPMIIIEDYRIVGLFTKDLFTKSAQETLEKLNWIIDELKTKE